MKKAGAFGMGIIVGAIAIGWWKQKDLTKARKDSNKYLSLYRELNQYLITKQMGSDLADYFEKNNIHTIAIYGLSYIGQRIIDDLEDSKVVVSYGIDARADWLNHNLDIYKPEEKLPPVDAIVVTAFDYDEIVEKIEDKVSCPILSFEEIIYGL